MLCFRGIVMSFVIDLILCQFSKILAIGSSLNPMVCLSIGSKMNNGTNHGFHPVKQDLIQSDSGWLLLIESVRTLSFFFK